MDIFRYLLPGFLIIFSYELLVSDNLPILTIAKDWVSQLTLKYTFVLSLVAYFIGFCIDPIGRQIRYKIVAPTFNTPVRTTPTWDKADSIKYILIKQYSDGNYQMIETWDMLKGMASNLSFGTMLLILVALLKMAPHICPYTLSPDWFYLSTFDWTYLLMGSVFATFCLFYQAHNFERYSVHDVDATVEALKLMEKSSQDQDTNAGKKSTQPHELG